MKKILLSAIFTMIVGLLSLQAQTPAPRVPADKTQEGIVQDTVIDNSNIPENAEPVIDDNMVDTTSTMDENKNDVKDKAGNNKAIPSDKTKSKNKNKAK